MSSSFNYQDLYRQQPFRAKVKYQPSTDPIIGPDDLLLLVSSTSHNDLLKLEGYEQVCRQDIETYLDMPSTKGAITDSYLNWAKYIELTHLPSQDQGDDVVVKYVRSTGIVSTLATSKYILDLTDEREPIVVFTDVPTYELSQDIQYPVSVEYVSGATVYKRDFIVRQAAEYKIRSKYYLGIDPYDDVSKLDDAGHKMLMQARVFRA